MYLIIGARGFLGSYILRAIIEKTEEKILSIARNIDGTSNTNRITWIQCDITKIDDIKGLAYKVKDIEPVNIIYLAAYHHPDLVEKNPRIAWDINITSLSNFLNIMENVRCLFYPSTDSVYGDSINTYHFKESDQLNPVNRYGKQKVAAECLVNTYGYNVVRYPFLISPSLSDQKKHFYDLIVDTIKQNNYMEMFSDSYRSSLDFGTAAELLVDLIVNYNESTPKILNISGDDDLSKYDIGLMIADKFGVSTDYILPINSVGNGNIFEAKRAQSTLLDNSLIKRTLAIKKIKIKI